ncbi:MAG: hypothetical protein L0191_20730 [Acidobacteria bacterium]|nr:hypothetical protein [Acidobacteriota bacterium]
MTDTTRIVGTTIVAPLTAGIVLSIINMAIGQPIDPLIVLLVGLGVGLAYGLMAGLLFSYDLSQPLGVGALLVDMTWSLPNTIAGLLLGNMIYPFFGFPSRELSRDQGWIAYKPRGTSGFGVDVLQTIGTVNIGGAGNHEKVHVVQARIFGPLFIPIVLVNYALTGLVQILFTITIGAILKATGVRDTAYLRPPASSAVKGFFGWIYYATVFELWAYATEH